MNQMKPIQFIFKCSIFCILLICSATAHAQKPVPNATIHLKGTLGEQPITMDLLKTKRAKYEYYQGTYYYDKYQVPIGLYDTESKTKNLLVFEEANSSMDQNESAKISGKLTDKGFDGEWKKGKKTFKVTLLIDQNKDLPSFDYFYFEDSIKFQPKKTETPRCDVSLQLLMPNKSVNAMQKMFIEQEIYKMFLDDSLANYLKPKSPADIFKVIKQQNFDDFKEFTKDFKPNEDIENPMSFSIEDHKSLNILYNENKRLCIESAFWWCARHVEFCV